jgi:hypothetical protein
MPDRARVIAAYNAWWDAQRAYRVEVLKHVKGWWMGDGPPPEVVAPKPVTREALQKLDALREAEGAALAAWRDVLGES